MAFIAEWNGLPNAYHMVYRCNYCHVERFAEIILYIYPNRERRESFPYTGSMAQKLIRFSDRSVTGPTLESVVQTPLYTQYLTSNETGPDVISNLSQEDQNLEKAMYQIIKTQDFSYSYFTGDDSLQYACYLKDNGVDA
jgi:hypothetical protein